MKCIIFGSLVSMVVFLVGCSTPQMGEYEADIVEAQLAQPTFEMECPETGCNFTRFAYNDPNKQIRVPTQTNQYDVLNNLIGLGGKAIVPLAMGWQTQEAVSGLTSLGKEGFRMLQGSGETHVTNVGDYSGDNAGRVGDYSGESSGRTGDFSGEGSGSTGDYSGPNSGNDGRIDSPNSNDGRMDSDNTDNSDNSTQSGGSPSGF